MKCRRDVVGRAFGQLVFPDPDDGPSSCGQCLVGVAVALDVGGEFGDPPFAVVRGDGGVVGARVPEAAVDVHGHPKPREDEVGATTKPRERGAVDEVAVATSMEGPA